MATTVITIIMEATTPLRLANARHCAHIFTALAHLFLIHEVGTITILTSQIRKLRLGEINNLLKAP